MGALLQFRIDILWLKVYSRLVFAMLVSEGIVKIEKAKAKTATIAISDFLFVFLPFLFRVFVVLYFVRAGFSLQILERTRGEISKFPTLGSVVQMRFACAPAC
jgi:hypothetical protein